MLAVDHLRVTREYLAAYRRRYPWQGIPDFECHVLAKYAFGMCSLLDSFPVSADARASHSASDIGVKYEVIEISDDHPFYCVYDAYDPDISIGYVVEL